jgi:hypothetical protein
MALVPCQECDIFHSEYGEGVRGHVSPVRGAVANGGGAAGMVSVALPWLCAAKQGRVPAEVLCWARCGETSPRRFVLRTRPAQALTTGVREPGGWADSPINSLASPARGGFHGREKDMAHSRATGVRADKSSAEAVVSARSEYVYLSWRQRRTVQGGRVSTWITS